VAGTVRVVLFASARTAAGTGRLDRPVPPEGVLVTEFLAQLVRDRPELAPIVRVARFVRNGVYLDGRRGRLGPGDEFAIHPPYSGG
jgi:molybdopterin converting factor small subunit